MATLTLILQTALDYVECYFVSYACGVLSAVIVALSIRSNKAKARLKKMKEFRRTHGHKVNP
jgi:hypothetical protein